MANPQLESFLAMAKGEPALLRQLSACPNLDAIAALGASLGFQFSGVELMRHQAEATLRLGEEEPAAAAAGVALEGHLWRMRIVGGCGRSLRSLLCSSPSTMQISLCLERADARRLMAGGPGASTAPS